MTETHPIRGLGQVIPALMIMGETIDISSNAAGKFGYEALVQTGLSTGGRISDFLTPIDHTNFTFVDSLPLGLKMAATLGIFFIGVGLFGGGLLLAEKGARNIKTWLES